MEHYFSSNPESKSEEKMIEYKFNDKEYSFITDNGVFSKMHVDFATNFLLEVICNEVYGNILDMGCGYGVIGIILSKMPKTNNVVMCDVNNRALDLARRNAKNNNVGNCQIIESNGFENINQKFDTIITNPPIRAGKEVIYKMYRDAKKHLNQGGVFYLVINKKHGAPSTITFLKTLFENVEVLDKKAGFNVIKCY